MGLFFDPSSQRTQVWSDGGGTQSCYIATLICRGILPKPDLAVMVNTGREISATFDYHRRYVIPALAKVGVELFIIDKSEYATVDLTSKNGKSILLPAFTNQSGEIGKLPTYCSGEWKRDSISRWLRSRGVEQCDMWMGYSLDEMRRVGKDRRQWIRKLYPLIDLRKSRYQCIAGVLGSAGPVRRVAAAGCAPTSATTNGSGCTIMSLMSSSWRACSRKRKSPRAMPTCSFTNRASRFAKLISA